MSFANRTHLTCRYRFQRVQSLCASTLRSAPGLVFTILVGKRNHREGCLRYSPCLALGGGRCTLRNFKERNASFFYKADRPLIRLDKGYEVSGLVGKAPYPSRRWRGHGFHLYLDNSIWVPHSPRSSRPKIQNLNMQHHKKPGIDECAIFGRSHFPVKSGVYIPTFSVALRLDNNSMSSDFTARFDRWNLGRIPVVRRVGEVTTSRTLPLVASTVDNEPCSLEIWD